MYLQGARAAANLALKLAPAEELFLSELECPQPDSTKKQPDSELEVYFHNLSNGELIGIYVHSVRVSLRNYLYNAELQVRHTFPASVERLNQLVEEALERNDLHQFFTREEMCRLNLATLGAYCYLLPREQEELVRKALWPYWKEKA